jgi:hypothetical protein
MRCESRDGVWDRQCDKEAGHTDGTTAEDRIHVNTRPGDILSWGQLGDARAAFAEAEGMY